MHHDEYLKCQSDPVYFMKNYLSQPTAADTNMLFVEESHGDMVANLTDKIVTQDETRDFKPSLMYAFWLAHFNEEKNVAIISKSRLMSNILYGNVVVAHDNLPKSVRINMKTNLVNRIHFENDSNMLFLQHRNIPVMSLGWTFDFVFVDDFSAIKNQLEFMQLLQSRIRT